MKSVGLKSELAEFSNIVPALFYSKLSGEDQRFGSHDNSLCVL